MRSKHAKGGHLIISLEKVQHWFPSFAYLVWLSSFDLQEMYGIMNVCLSFFFQTSSFSVSFPDWLQPILNTSLSYTIPGTKNLQYHTKIYRHFVQYHGLSSFHVKKYLMANAETQAALTHCCDIYYKTLFLTASHLKISHKNTHRVRKFKSHEHQKNTQKMVYNYF